MGLLGDGGVHSHQRHMEAIIEMARREKVGRFICICSLTGAIHRRTAPSSLCLI